MPATATDLPRDIPEAVRGEPVELTHASAISRRALRRGQYASAHPARARIARGWIGLEKTMADGRRQVLALFLPGDTLTEQIAGDAAETLQFVAMSDAVLEGAPLSDAPGSAQRVVEELLLLHQRALRQIVRLGRMTAIERMADLLLELYERQAPFPSRSERVRIDLPLTQAQLSDILGLSSVHINRCLKALRDHGAVRLRHGWAEFTPADLARQIG
ncbi:MAG: Crp/Fnr family transcriptional regulator [Pseudomonadota bacterium]